MTIALRRTLFWTTVPPLIVLVCWLDSVEVQKHFAYGQWVANLVMILYFVLMFRTAPKRLERMMKYGVVIATAGEALFSLVFGMYEYHDHNIPIYVPPGHAIIYGAVYYFVREPIVLRWRTWLPHLMLAASIGYAILWYQLHNDLYGLVCTGLFVLLVVLEPQSRMFFLTMFILVGFLEQIGTRYGCWFWWEHAFDKYAWLPSGNPPSGISVFYFAFDVLCLRAHLTRHPKIKERLKRMQKRRHAAQVPAVAAT